MKRNVSRLSSPEFNGRQTGTLDDLKSGLFVAEQFRSQGLHPAGSQPFGPFLKSAGPTIGNEAPELLSEPWMDREPVTASRIQDGARLEFFLDSTMSPASPGEEYLPVLDSPSADLIAPVVFVGYGISDPARGVDDYAGVVVGGKVVLFLRGKPEHYATPVRHADKAKWARERGAVAYLTATGPILSSYEARRGLGHSPLAYYGNPEGEVSLPGAWISTGLAEKILDMDKATGKGSLRDLQEQLNHSPASRSKETRVKVRLSWVSHQEQGVMANVQGAILGADPALQKETVVIGAHRDHFGLQAGLLFPGADDNASGTAVLLEVARIMREAKLTPKRTILFVSFSGEEQNLLGSRLYVRQPARPLAGTVAMINVDHAGVGNGRLTVGVAGLPKSVAELAGNEAGLAEKLDFYGFFPGGDHVPFNEAKVPTLTVVSGGPHPHFHQATDRTGTIQPDIMETVARFVLALAWQLAN